MATAAPPKFARSTRVLELAAVALFVPVLAGWTVQLATGRLAGFWGTAWHIAGGTFWFVVLGCLAARGIRTIAGEWRDAGWHRATATQWVGRVGLVFMTLTYLGNVEEYPTATWTLVHRIATGCFFACFAAHVSLRFLRPAAGNSSG